MSAIKNSEVAWEPEDHKSVQAALIAAQTEFGKVAKGSTNPAFKSRYADLADVASVVIPTLNRHGVAVYHVIENDAMKTVFHHASSGTEIACAVPLVVDKQNMQGMKSATTYAKRIGLESLSGVAPEDDDGNAAAAAPPLQKITEDEVRILEDMIEETGTDVKKFKGWLWAGVPGQHTLSDIHQGQMYDRAMNALKAKQKQAEA